MWFDLTTQRLAIRSSQKNLQRHWTDGLPDANRVEAFQMMRRHPFVGLKHEEEIVRVPWRHPSRHLRRAARAKERQDIAGAFQIAFAKGLSFEHELVVPVLVRLTGCVDRALMALRSAIS